MHPTVSVPSLTEVKQLIDHRLAEYCKVRTIAAKQVGDQYETLWKTIGTLLQSGGKRFRPYMLITAFSTYADDDADIETILPAALAQELIHQAMLVHDDIIDRDTVRYGIKNVSGQYDEIYKPHIEAPDERSHMALSSSLLAGDVLLSDAYHFLSRVDTTPDRLMQAVTIFSSGVFEVVGGELLDTESSFLKDTVISAETIARFKTASYSFISPITTGAVLGGASVSDVQMLRQFSEYLGVGYQLRDDLLGVFGNPAQTGKSVATDLIEGKRTFLIEQFEALANDEQKVAFSKMFHKADASELELATIRDLLVKAGAREKVEDTIELLRAKAEEILALLTISETSAQALRELVGQSLSREK